MAYADKPCSGTPDSMRNRGLNLGR